MHDHDVQRGVHQGLLPRAVVFRRHFFGLHARGCGCRVCVRVWSRLAQVCPLLCAMHSVALHCCAYLRIQQCMRDMRNGYELKRSVEAISSRLRYQPTAGCYRCKAVLGSCCDFLLPFRKAAFCEEEQQESKGRFLRLWFSRVKPHVSSLYRVGAYYFSASVM